MNDLDAYLEIEEFEKSLYPSRKCVWFNDFECLKTIKNIVNPWPAQKNIMWIRNIRQVDYKGWYNNIRDKTRVYSSAYVFLKAID